MFIYKWLNNLLIKLKWYNNKSIDIFYTGLRLDSIKTISSI